MRAFAVYSYDIFGQRGWIGEFDTEMEACECAIRESSDLYSNEYCVFRVTDRCLLAVYQYGTEQAALEHKPFVSI